MGLKLDDITLSFDRVGQPQLITGTASASWENALDIDSATRLALARSRPHRRVGRRQEPLRHRAQLRRGVHAGAAGEGRDQGALRPRSGEPRRRGRERSAHRSGAHQRRACCWRSCAPVCRAAPSSRSTARCADAADAHAFQGEFALRGTSLARFLNWAVKDPCVVRHRAQRRPVLAAGPSRHERQRRRPHRGGRRDRGHAAHRRGALRERGAHAPRHRAGGPADRRRPALAGRRRLPQGSLGGRRAASATKEAGAPPQRRWLDAATTDLSLRLRAAELRTGTQPLRDVDMDVAIEPGRMSMRSCKFVTERWTRLRVWKATSPTWRASRAGICAGCSPRRARTRFSTFVRLWGLSEDDAGRAMRYAALAPMRLAGTIRLGQRDQGRGRHPRRRQHRGRPGRRRRPASTAASTIGAMPAPTSR